MNFKLIFDGEGNGTPLQQSCLENPMDRGAWQAAVHGVVKSRTRLRDFTFTFMHWRRKWQPTPVFLPGESQGWGSLVGCRLWGRIESDTTEVTQQDLYLRDNGSEYSSFQENLFLIFFISQHGFKTLSQQLSHLIIFPPKLVHLKGKPYINSKAEILIQKKISLRKIKEFSN